jgi:1-acyl-sn-glycerol-3-phosphate acyltransferase
MRHTTASGRHRAGPPPSGDGHREGGELRAFHTRALGRGVNPLLYWPLRAILLPAFLVYFRLQRFGREHLPARGPLLLASNHRSFLDPFVIGLMVRRPVYFMAKRELFEKRWQAWILSSLGAFPVDRGAGDAAAIETARAILQRGDCVVVFPEGTRVRPGPLGAPRRGVGRLALETGAPVAPIAVFGTEDVRRGWRIRPRKVSLRAGRPLRFPLPERASPGLAAAVTERIWACVSLQWEWLGGQAPQRDALKPGGRSPTRRRRASRESSARQEANAA